MFPSDSPAGRRSSNMPGEVGLSCPPRRTRPGAGLVPRQDRHSDPSAQRVLAEPRRSPHPIDDPAGLGEIVLARRRKSRASLRRDRA